MREFPAEYSQESQKGIHEKLANLLRDLAEDNKVQLIPMHYFHIGGDDRKFLNSLRFDLELENIEVQNEPLSLYQTFLRFEQAQACVGMRFHSVVFQTALNGKNLVLDYTEPGKGKITGFLRDWNLEETFKKRYVNLQSWNSEKLDLKSVEQVVLPGDELSQRLARYEELLKTVL
jgi:polysaccharide pyruvyl transferase WcaK-like protein